MKKMIAIMLCALLLVPFAACNKTPEQTGGDQPAVEATPESEPIDGGWTKVSDTALTDELIALFEKAVGREKGVVYEPVALLETQVVAGMNYCFLATKTVVVPDAQPERVLVYIYEDLSGNAEVTSIVSAPETEASVPEDEIAAPEPTLEEESAEERPDDPTMHFEYFSDGEPVPGTIAGGWQVAYKPEMTDALNAVFQKALDGLLGVNYEPVALLGTQVVAGTNYCFLAKATVVYPNAQPKYMLVYVYEDLAGNAQILNFADMPVVPNEYGTTEPIDSDEMLSGGWFYTESYEITDKIRDAFGKALNSYGYLAVYVPVANLAEQIVAGTNRCILVRFTERIPDALPQYKLMYVYEPLDGSPEITGVYDFDFGGLCTYGA